MNCWGQLKMSDNFPLRKSMSGIADLPKYSELAKEPPDTLPEAVKRNAQWGWLGNGYLVPQSDAHNWRYTPLMQFEGQFYSVPRTKCCYAALLGFYNMGRQTGLLGCFCGRTFTWQEVEEWATK